MTGTGQDHEPWLAQDVPAVRVGRQVVRAVIPRNTRFKLYFRMLDTPLLSEMYVRGRGRLRRRRVRTGTRLVIEAFPSSASTFCRQAILLANPDLAPDDLCSHTHSARVVRHAVRRRLPCIVVVRDPRDAVSSMVQRFTGVHLDSAFDYYTRYHASLLSLQASFVVAPFEVVTSDLSYIVAQCNDRFGTRFASPAEAGIDDSVVRADADRRLKVMRDASESPPAGRRPHSRKPTAEFLAEVTKEQARAMYRAVEVYGALLGCQPSGWPGPAEPAA